MTRLGLFTAFGLCLSLAALVRAQPAVEVGSVRSFDGVMIHYDVRGAGEPALVLLHGWTNTRAIFGRHPETLSLTNRVVTLDLAGHGASGTNREAWTIEAFGYDVAAVVDHLQLDSVVLVGFSMGGAVALEAAERLGDRVKGIVLVDALRDVGASERRDPAQMEALFRARWSDPTFIRAFAFTPDAPDSLVAYVMAMNPPEPQEHWFDVLRANWTWMDEGFEDAARQYDGPIAAIYTTTRPDNADVMRRYFPSLTVDTLQGVGHAGILLQRVEDFDARLQVILDRFSSD